MVQWEFVTYLEIMHCRLGTLHTLLHAQCWMDSLSSCVRHCVSSIVCSRPACRCCGCCCFIGSSVSSPRFFFFFFHPINPVKHLMPSRHQLAAISPKMNTIAAWCSGGAAKWRGTLWALTQWWIATGISHRSKELFAFKTFPPARMTGSSLTRCHCRLPLSTSKIILFGTLAPSPACYLISKFKQWTHLLAGGSRACLGPVSLCTGAAENSHPAVAPGPRAAAGQGSGHPWGGQTCPPGGAGAPQRPAAPAGCLLTAQGEGVWMWPSCHSLSQFLKRQNPLTVVVATSSLSSQQEVN